jgi:hypothetical protein
MLAMAAPVAAARNFLNA